MYKLDHGVIETVTRGPSIQRIKNLAVLTRAEATYRVINSGALLKAVAGLEWAIGWEGLNRGIQGRENEMPATTARLFQARPPNRMPSISFPPRPTGR